jgi:hypothetical protein
MKTNQTNTKTAPGGNTTTKATTAKTAARTKKPASDGTKPKARKPRATKLATGTPTAEAIPEHATRRSPAPEEIAASAYYLFLERGAQHGFHDQDWWEAERRLTGTHD